MEGRIMKQRINEIDGNQLEYNIDLIMQKWRFYAVDTNKEKITRADTKEGTAFDMLNRMLEEAKITACCMYEGYDSRVYAVSKYSLTGEAEDKEKLTAAEKAFLKFEDLFGFPIRELDRRTLTTGARAKRRILQFCLLSLNEYPGVHQKLILETSVRGEYSGEHVTIEYNAKGNDYSPTDALIILDMKTVTMTSLNHLDWEGDSSGDRERIQDIYQRVDGFFVRAYCASKEEIFKGKNAANYFSPIKAYCRQNKKNRVPTLNPLKIKKKNGKYSSKLAMLSHLNDLIVNTGYIKNKSIPFTTIDVERYNGDNAYKNLSKCMYQFFDGKTIHVTIGKEVKDKEAAIMRLEDAFSKLKERSAIPQKCFISYRIPAGIKKEEMCLYVIEEGKGDKENESDISHKDMPTPVTQHIVAKNMTDDKGETKAKVIHACMKELFCKYYAFTKASPICTPKNITYIYCEPGNKFDQCENPIAYKAVHKGDSIEYAIVKDYRQDPDIAAAIPYDLKPDKITTFSYAIIRKENDSTSVIRVYDTPLFAVADIEKLSQIMEKNIKDGTTAVAKWRIEEYLQTAAENVSPEDDRSQQYREKIEEYSENNLIPLNALKGSMCNYRKQLHYIILQEEGAGIISDGLKGKEDIDTLYPAFSKITYSNQPPYGNGRGIYFVRWDQNPLLGINKIETGTHLRKYEVVRGAKYSGENFIHEVFAMMYVPFVSYGKLSVKPYYAKLLTEYRGALSSE